MIDIQLTPTGRPPRYVDGSASGWRGLECILADLLDRWCPRRNLALEFGVEHGFSTVALSNYFTRVIGVDHFLGDEHAGLTPPDVDRYRDTRLRLAPFPNIELFRMSAQDFMARCDPGTRFDLVHVDAKHDGQTTYDLTTWGARHADLVLVHDTLPFPEVAPACDTVAAEQGMIPYNYPACNGLGILVRERAQ